MEPVGCESSQIHANDTPPTGKVKLTCHACSAECKKFGRFGPLRIQRYRCRQCGKTFSDDSGRLFDELRIDEDKGVQIVHLLTEGLGVRATARFVGVQPCTVLNVFQVASHKCAKLLDRLVTKVETESIQVDEIWNFVGCKQANIERGETERGDFYTFLAIDRRSKLVISHYTGRRNDQSTDEFVNDLASRVSGVVQITSDGWLAYPDAIRTALLGRLHYAVMQKLYGVPEADIVAQRRYSPPACIGVRVDVRAGNPREDRITTSHVERLNLSVRTFNRRFVRLGLGWSRKLNNHRASVALFVAAYNFCKKHSTTGCTPAEGAGITNHQWTIRDLLERAE